MTLPSVWEDGTWPGLPSLSGEVQTQVCVVGLGGAGLSAILRLRQLGVEVAGIDAGAVGGGASGRNGGFLLAGTSAFHHEAVATFGRERAVRIHRLTADAIGEMAAQMPAIVRLVGSLRIASSLEEMKDCDAQLAAMAADGLAAERYDGPEGRGLLFPGDGAFDPLARARLLAREAMAAGAQLFERSPASSAAADRVATPGGQVRCERVIVAVDGGLERLVPSLGDRVRTARAQMLATAPVPERRFVHPVYARWGYDYYQQLPDGRVILGGFRDRGGDAEWSCSPEPSEPVQSLLERFLRADLAVDEAITHRWAGCIGFTDDRLPVIETTADGVVAAGGYSGTGNVLSVLCGRAAAELAVNGASALADLLDGGR